MKPNTNLDFTVSRPLREIHEIELSSRCNLACRYCPHGVALTPALAREMAKARALVYVSTHRPEKAGPAVQILDEAGEPVIVRSPLSEPKHYMIRRAIPAPFGVKLS